MTCRAAERGLTGHTGEATLREAMRHFATGVAVVTATTPGGELYGTTANAVASVSLEPPLVLVCLRNESETLRALEASGRFAVSLLAADQEALAVRFARAADDATWTGVAHALGAGGAPLLHGSLATLDCEVHRIDDGGDHRIVIGRVLAASERSEPGRPLLFFRSAFGLLDDPAARTPAPPRQRTPPHRTPQPRTPQPRTPQPRTPQPRTQVRLPTPRGELQVSTTEQREPGGGLTLVAAVGEPRGRDGILLYVHEGCIAGDALRNLACGSHESLETALATMQAAGAGVVVYHRPDPAAAGSCCLGGGGVGRLGRTAIEAAVATAAELELGCVRLLHRGDEARLLRDAGLDVCEALPLHGEPPHEKQLAAAS